MTALYMSQARLCLCSAERGHVVEKSKVQYESLLLSSACESVLEIGTAGNLYIDGCAPWSLFKQGGASFDSAAKDLVLILEAMRIIAVALSPVTPKLCLSIYRQLGYTEKQFNAVTWSDAKWGGLKAGQVMAPPNPIFARIEVITEDEGGPPVEKKVLKKKQMSPQTQSSVGA
nr:methionine--tRNA ligase, chloroplastic/mitochondrial [Tanacetum cinerariifolium]